MGTFAVYSSLRIFGEQRWNSLLGKEMVENTRITPCGTIVEISANDVTCHVKLCNRNIFMPFIYSWRIRHCFAKLCKILRINTANCWASQTQKALRIENGFQLYDNKWEHYVNYYLSHVGIWCLSRICEETSNRFPFPCKLAIHSKLNQNARNSFLNFLRHRIWDTNLRIIAVIVWLSSH